MNTFEPARELQLSHKPSPLKAKDFNEKFYEARPPEPVNHYAYDTLIDGNSKEGF